MVRSPESRDAVVTAVCPECGADIPLIGGRWLAAHREGITEYSYRPGSGTRCEGSLARMDAHHPQNRERGT